VNYAKYLRAYVVVVVMAIGLGNAAVVRGQSIVGQPTRFCEEDKPFTAHLVEHIDVEQPDGTELKQDRSGLRARDSQGRFYVELNGSRIMDQIMDRIMEERGQPKGVSIHAVSVISDCQTRQNATVYPELKRVEITPTDAVSSQSRGGSVYEYMTDSGQLPNRTLEDLGFKEIEGVLTHGYRVTIIGNESDGEWNGKPIFVVESWVSDDLAEIVSEKVSALKVKKTATRALTEIKLEEPPKSLFEIPTDYTVEDQRNEYPWNQSTEEQKPSSAP
jgi:hypothetical protein